ncbi:MAG: hypothetical protein KL840_24880 [Aquamicrobium sp.]|nr:hypothetical protein [Aquamicrobium sp.]
MDRLAEARIRPEGNQRKICLRREIALVLIDTKVEASNIAPKAISPRRLLP